MEALIAARAIQGIGGSNRDAPHADAPLRRVPGRTARRCSGRVVGNRRARGGRRAARRRRGRRGDRVAVDLLAERADRAGRAAVVASPHGEPRAGQGARPAGLALASGGLLGLVWGLVHGNADGWGSPQIVGSLTAGVLLLAAFVAWEARAKGPMLPLRFFRSRAFSAANGASLAMYFGMFGSVFLLSQFFQTAQGYSPLEAGLRVLPWTAMPMLVAPIAGALSDRIGGRPFLAGGLALQALGLAWIAAVSEPDVGYSSLIGPFIVSGIGMGMFFAPVANIVLSAVGARDEGKASGANERDPRGRRRLRRRRARLDLRPHRRLRVGRGLQRRPRGGTLGRRGRRRRRCAGRAGGARQAAQAGARSSRRSTSPPSVCLGRGRGFKPRPRPARTLRRPAGRRGALRRGHAGSGRQPLQSSVERPRAVLERRDGPQRLLPHGLGLLRREAAEANRLGELVLVLPAPGREVGLDHDVEHVVGGVEAVGVSGAAAPGRSRTRSRSATARPRRPRRSGRRRQASASARCCPPRRRRRAATAARSALHTRGRADRHAVRGRSASSSASRRR